MANVIIKALKNGPYEVSGGAQVLDYTARNTRRARSIRSTFAAAGIQRRSLSATTVTKTSGSSRRDRGLNTTHYSHYSITPIRDDLDMACWSIGVMGCV